MLYEEVYIMTFQKVEKGLEIPSKQEKDGTGGGQEEWAWCGARARSRDAGVDARRTSETRGPVISQMMLVGDSGDQICDYLWWSD